MDQLASKPNVPKGREYCETPGTSCIYDESDDCVNCGRHKGWRKNFRRNQRAGLRPAPLSEETLVRNGITFTVQRPTPDSITIRLGERVLHRYYPRSHKGSGISDTGAPRELLAIAKQIVRDVLLGKRERRLGILLGYPDQGLSGVRKTIYIGEYWEMADGTVKFFYYV